MTVAADHELVLEREFDAPPEAVYRCWTDPDLIPRWFVPRPWTISKVEQDLRPGGSSSVTMKDPEGNEFPNPGVYLEVVPNRRLVFTDAFVGDWVPAGPFMVAIVEFAPLEGGRTRYRATARHWTAEAKAQHEQMGFLEGWGQCADQLAELLATL
ncbi:MAG TPA: SRPBCC family protein [Caulobacter sp.]|nr:SRPBCC family protein [Caulobacter sp.]